MKGRLYRWAALVLALALAVTCCGCGGKKDSGVIHVATKPMTEQYILGEMFRLLIEENTDLTVELTKGVGGGTANIQAGLLTGDFDLYPEYTSTGWLHVLKETEIPDNETLYKELCEQYKEKYNLEWLGLYGFNNTFGLLVDSDSAKEYDLKTYSDLARASGNLIFGAGYDYYEREDGYTALCAAYGMDFKEHKDMDSGLKYTALAERDVNVITVYTTDAQVSIADAVLLEDDQHFFVDYFCGTVARGEVLEAHPELREALCKLNGRISNDEMAEMNYRLEVNHEDEAVIAKEFLVGKGLIAG